MNESPKLPKKPAILILGAPGAGKGTQGAILAQIPRFYHYSSGDVFRQLDTQVENRMNLNMIFQHFRLILIPWNSIKQ